MATADCKGGQKSTKGTPNHFKKLLEGPCPNHAFPVKHLYKDYGLMKWFLFGGSNKGVHRGDPKPAVDDAEGKDGGFPTLDGCLMILRGSTDYDSKLRKKLACHEVYTIEPAVPSFLRWLESAITFDWTDHPESVPHRDDIRSWSTRSSVRSGSPRY